MAKLYVFNMISLDGYFARLNGSLDWHNVDDEFNRFAVDQLKHTSAIIFGRVTYEMMYSFWPTDFAVKNDPIVAGIMNNLPKIVASRTLNLASWQNTKLINDNLNSEIKKIKDDSSKDVAVFGSSKLCVSLLNAKLVDELRIMVNPVILGSGKPLFEGISKDIRLKLTGSQQFKSGNNLLTYAL